MNQYQPAPAGEIEIVAASIGEVAWKTSDDNPRGECLRLRLRPAGNYAFVFSDTPLDWGRMLENVRKAVGTSSDYTPEEFIGRRARVVLKHYTAKDGTTRATVARWLPQPVPVSDGKPATLTDAIAAWASEQPRQAVSRAAGKPASKPSRNAVPRHGADDDIPF
jgi:hypothetical protein